MTYNDDSNVRQIEVTYILEACVGLGELDGLAAAILQLQYLVLYRCSVARLIEDGPMEGLDPYLSDVFVQSGRERYYELELVHGF